jgi:arylsulfatase
LFGACTAAAIVCACSGLSAAELPRDVLPLPDPPFRGTIGATPAQSKPDWPQRLEAPEGAPNVLLIMSDDVGFAASSTFGGPVPTPNLDRLAKAGLIFNRFHTTAICSPSRAALLTGRNSHNVGMGELSDAASGYPGYNGVIPQSAASVARVLQLNGYSTAMFGKHHDLPWDQQSGAGPFTQWPTGLGFDYFYGFVGGDVHQWQPRLWRGNTRVDDSERAGEVLDQRLADDAITWIHNQKAAAPDRPFMIYLATGSLHAPQHAPKDWIDRFKGKFDQGWDEVRKQTYARQLASEIIPKGTELTPRPDRIPAWSKLSQDARRYAARSMEVAAGALAFQDAQVGRILDEIDRMGQSGNTLVIFVVGDNGASGEGAELGVTNELGSLLNGVKDSEQWRASQVDSMGGPTTYENYPIGWAWALDTPFRWTKQFASYLGGIRNGLVISWPQRIHEYGAVRSQFSHLIDIAPTILEAAGVPQPKSVFGVTQQPMDGISLVPWFSPGHAEQPRTQYFQISGAVGIYHDGWFAGAPTGRMPWEFKPPVSADPMSRKWELYNLRNDFSQAHDLALANPKKLDEMKAVFRAEAEHNHVLPLDDKFSLARDDLGPPPRTPRRNIFDYWSADTSVASAAAPSFAGRSFTIEAELTVPEQADGVVLATGSMFGGWSFFLDGGRPVVVHALSQKPQDQTRIEAESSLGAGPHHLRYVFSSNGGRGASGTVQIFEGEKLLAEGQVPRTIIAPAGIGETLDIGRDTGVPVTVYRTEHGRLEGQISHVRVTLP